MWVVWLSPGMKSRIRLSDTAWFLPHCSKTREHIILASIFCVAKAGGIKVSLLLLGAGLSFVLPLWHGVGYKCKCVQPIALPPPTPYSLNVCFLRNHKVRYVRLCVWIMCVLPPFTWLLQWETGRGEKGPEQPIPIRFGIGGWVGYPRASQMGANTPPCTAGSCPKVPTGPCAASGRSSGKNLSSGRGKELFIAQTFCYHLTSHIKWFT